MQANGFELDRLARTFASLSRFPYQNHRYQNAQTAGADVAFGHAAIRIDHRSTPTIISR